MKILFAFCLRLWTWNNVNVLRCREKDKNTLCMLSNILSLAVEAQEAKGRKPLRSQPVHRRLRQLVFRCDTFIQHTRTEDILLPTPHSSTSVVFLAVCTPAVLPPDHTPGFYICTYVHSHFHKSIIDLFCSSCNVFPLIHFFYSLVGFIRLQMPSFFDHTNCVVEGVRQS